MCTLNITVEDIQRQIERIHNLYKDSLDNIFDNNIDNIMAKIIYTKPEPLR